MLYAKRFGAFMPLVSLVTASFVTYLAKPELEKHSPNSWQLVILPVGIGLFAGVFLIAYLANLLIIRCFGSEQFRRRVRERWRDTLAESPSSGKVAAADYVDTVANLQIRFSMPSVIRDVVSELSSERQRTAHSLQKTVDQLKSGNDLRGFLNLLSSRWRQATDLKWHQPTLIDDPIYGCLTLDNTLSTLIAQPIVQRLSRIKQLSFSYTQFPSATHSRLSHVLGVAHNVETALSGIFARGVYYQEGAQQPSEFSNQVLNKREEIIRRGKVLAILHDLGHGPFGYALDNYVGYLNQHQQTANPDKLFSRLYVERYLSNSLKTLGFDPEDLMQTLDPGGRHLLTGLDPLVADLVDSSMDMDRMDYLTRDAHMTGLSMGFTNASALIQSIRPVKVGETYFLAYDERGAEYMEHLLYAREAMYRNCYEHPRKRAAERIFERLIREVTKDDPELIDELYILTDEEVLSALRLVKLPAKAERLLDQLVTDSEFEVVHQVLVKSPNISDEARAWVRSATMGNKGKKSYVDQPATWEDAIARESIGAQRVFQIQVIVAPPSAYEQKFDGATILERDELGLYRTNGFFERTSRVKDVLSAMHPARSMIKVMCDSKVTEAERKRIKLASISELGL